VSLARYAAIVLAVVGGTLLALLPVLNPRARAGALVGGALAGGNTLLAYFLVLWSSRRSTKTFLWAVLGGMFGRMVLLLGAVAVGVLVLDLPPIPLAVSLTSYFILFLVLELAVLHRHTTAGRSEAR
jgi:hypothetical protein